MPLYQVEVTEKKVARYCIYANSPEDARAKYSASTDPDGDFGDRPVPSGLLAMNVSVNIQQVG